MKNFVHALLLFFISFLSVSCVIQRGYSARDIAWFEEEEKIREEERLQELKKERQAQLKIFNSEFPSKISYWRTLKRYDSSTGMPYESPTLGLVERGLRKFIDDGNKSYYARTVDGDTGNWFFTPEQAYVALDSLATVRNEIQEEIKAYNAIRVEKQKEQKRKELLELKEAEQLRRAFREKNIQRRNEFVRKHKANLKYLEALKAKVDDQYVTELDALERQYLGRFGQEAFKIKKERLVDKFDEKYGSIIVKIEQSRDEIQKYLDDRRDEFNRILEQKGNCWRFSDNYDVGESDITDFETLKIYYHKVK